MARIYVFNGPNLNLLGLREPGVYGSATLSDVEALCRDAAARYGHEIDFRQTNHEGVLVDWLQEAGFAQKRGEALGVILNAGALTHTSVAVHDAIRGASVSMIEVHITNVHAREEFRHHSYLSPVAKGIIVGLGIKGYALAVTALSDA